MSEISNTTNDVYLSYSQQDKKWADAACAVLERQRVRCWIAPRDIAPGDELGAAIVKGINQSRIMVLIFSGHANDSAQVRREVERAISRGIVVLPVRIEEVRPEGAMEFALGNTHWLDAFTPPVEQHLEKLARSVKGLLGQDVGPVADPEVEVKATQSSAELPVTGGPRRPLAFWPAVISASLLGLAALAVIVIIVGRGGRDTQIRGPHNTADTAEDPLKDGNLKSPVTSRVEASVPLVPPLARGDAGSPSVGKSQGPAPGGVGVSEFVPLFNGEDRSGWRVVGNTHHTWKVLRGGVLEGSGPPPASILETTRADFSDYHLRIETQIASGPNSGIAFRITDSDGESPRYMVYIEGTEQDKRLTGSLSFSQTGAWIALATADPVVPIQTGEWFTVEVIADGDVITAIVKGREVAKFKTLRRKLTSGAIGLICRGNSRVLFRRIEIRRLHGAGKGGSPGFVAGAGKDSEQAEWSRLARISGRDEWRIENDQLVQTTLEDGAIWFGDPAWSNYSFSAEVMLVKSAGHVALHFRRGGEQTAGEYFYSAGLRNVDRGSLCSIVNGKFSVLPSQRSRDAALTLGRWHRMRIDVQGKKLTAYLDGRVTFTVSDSAKLRGCVGFQAAKSICRFRNVKVTAPSGKTLWEGLPEIPTASSFGEPLRVGHP